MGWTLRMIKRTLKRKRRDLFWYSYKRKTRYGLEMALGDDVSGADSGSRSVPSDSSSSSDGGVLRGTSDSTSSASSLVETSVVPPTETSTADPATSTPGLHPLPTPSSAASSAEPSNYRETGSSVLDLDFDSDRSRSTTSVPRIFNIDAHIDHLRRDVQQLEKLAADAEVTFERTVHRIKERLGRRVWGGKDVWFTDERKRVPVTKEAWRKTVNFVVPEETKLFR